MATKSHSCFLELKYKTFIKGKKSFFHHENESSFLKLSNFKWSNKSYLISKESCSKWLRLNLVFRSWWKFFLVLSILWRERDNNLCNFKRKLMIRKPMGITISNQLKSCWESFSTCWSKKLSSPHLNFVKHDIKYIQSMLLCIISERGITFTITHSTASLFLN